MITWLEEAASVTYSARTSTALRRVTGHHGDLFRSWVRMRSTRHCRGKMS